MKIKRKKEESNQTKKTNPPMKTSTKNYTKKKPNKKRTDRTLGQKQSYTDKITQRSIHIHTHKKRKSKIYIYLKKEESKQINKQIYQ